MQFIIQVQINRTKAVRALLDSLVAGQYQKEVFDEIHIANGNANYASVLFQRWIGK